MKKIITLIAAISIFLISSLSYAEDEISVTLDGEKIIFDQPPIIVEDRTLVPMRAIFEKLGFSVDWNGEILKVTATRGNDTIRMTINDKNMYFNDKVIELDVAPQIVSSRTLIPVRAVSECSGYDIEWDGLTKTVKINRNESTPTIPPATMVPTASPKPTYKPSPSSTATASPTPIPTATPTPEPTQNPRIEELYREIEQTEEALERYDDDIREAESNIGYRYSASRYESDIQKYNRELSKYQDQLFQLNLDNSGDISIEARKRELAGEIAEIQDAIIELQESHYYAMLAETLTEDRDNLKEQLQDLKNELYDILY